MPCRDFYDDHPEAYFRDFTEPALRKQIAFAESALCAALNALDNIPARQGARGRANTLDMIDYESVGITKEELRIWREKHAILDKKHREEAIAAAKASGLAKLNPSERKALGIE